MTHLVPALRPVLGSPFRRADLYRRAGELPSFHINPAALGHARDLITGTVLGGGTVNSATPAWEVGPDGILALPAANAPVIEYGPVTLQCLGARIWGSVTNLTLRSEDFTAAAWTAFRSTPSANTTTSPNNQTTADKLTEDTSTSSTHGIFQALTIANSTTYTFSVFVKPDGRTQVILGLNLGAGEKKTWFNLSNGTTGTNGNDQASIIPYPNGWFRVAITSTSSSTTATQVIKLTNADNVEVYTGNGVSSISLFGAQLNTGPLAPYVPTTTTTASSTAEATDITSLPGGINNIRTVYARVRTPASGIRGIISLNDNSSSNRLELLTNGTDPRAVAVTSGSTVADINGGTIAANTTFRIAARFDGDNYAVSINGAPVVTDNAGARAIVDRIFLGRTQAGEYINGIIEELATWTQPLGNSQLQAVAA